MVSLQNLRAQRNEILEIAARHGASAVRVFGSIARGDNTASSDIDLLVRFEPERSLFDHGGLIEDLEALLGRQVDVVSEAGMRDRFKSVVAKEAVAL